MRSGLLFLHRYEASRGGRPERMVSGSDDFTMFLWAPAVGKEPLARMTGHLQLINQVGVVVAGEIEGVSPAVPWHLICSPQETTMGHVLAYLSPQDCCFQKGQKALNVMQHAYLCC